MTESGGREPRRPAVTKAAGRGKGSSRCSDPPPDGLLRAIDQFNRGEYWEQHETLEDIWIEEADPVRHLYQGILQVGVAFHHWRRSNFRGADLLLERGLTYLQPFRPSCMGVDVERLVMEAAACHAELRRLGPRRMALFDPARFPRVHLVGESETTRDISE
ncbi:MAG TPA: DUF309 domain-containing protein [Dehalococcoidia bacterium]|nr:DUF309 domain-containing protein [Dehalococcoidia bacterium]